MKTVSKYLSMVCLVLCVTQSPAQDLEVYKSMFVYNFIKHIQWPADISIVRIGITGSDADLKIAFEKMAKTKSTASQQIIIEKFEGNKVNDFQIIYFDSKAATSLFSEVIGLSRNMPIVLISENDAWIEKGAYISFRLVDNKLKFLINKGAFDKSGLRVSSALLSMSI
jgi:hypothetical protein